MIARWHGIDRLLQRRPHLHIEHNAGLLPPHGHHAVANVLAAHTNHAAASLPGLQKQFVGKALARPDLVMGLKLPAFLGGPCVMAG